MKYVETGNGRIPMISLLAILSISLCINMPGLAVSPMLGKLRHIFNSTELESQLLTSLPNLVMIPVVLIAGKIATPKWQTAVLTTGLSIFLVAGVLSLFADTMGFLIFLGCMVGVGCALVVPIAAGMISEWFMRKERQRDLGLKSTTSNLMVIIANVYVGIIAAVNWHAAFATYLVPLIPLCLVPFMTQKYIKGHLLPASASGPVPADDDTASEEESAPGKDALAAAVASDAAHVAAEAAKISDEALQHSVAAADMDALKADMQKMSADVAALNNPGTAKPAAGAAAGSAPAPAPVYHFQGSESLRLLIALIVLYMILTYCTTSISYYAPFMMDKYHMNTTQVGLVTAAYYGMVAVSGAIVARIRHWTGQYTMFVCLAVIAAGLVVMGYSHNFVVLFVASLIIGFAYGVVQPIIYNKTTYIAPTHKAGMTYFGYVLSSNYMAIMMVPFVDGFFRKIFKSGSPGFEFVFSGVVVALLLVWAMVEHKNYVFTVSATTAAPSAQQVEAAEAATEILDKK